MRLFCLLLMLVSVSVRAGDFYGGQVNIDAYDSATGLYYRGVQPPSEGGFLGSSLSRSAIVNLNIFDPANGTSTLLFKEPQQDGVSVILFESGYKDGAIEFSNAPYGAVLNNMRLEKREPKNKLLVGVLSKSAKQTKLFVADKRGGNLKLLVAVPATADWHLDVRNSKLRVVHQTGNGVRIDSYDW